MACLGSKIVQPYLPYYQVLLDSLTLITLIVTALFVILYWQETQAMKKEMIIQNRINSQQLKSSLLPALDVKLEKPISGFTYDLFVENKGNGPAFNIIVRRLTLPNENQQKLAIHSTTKGKLQQFSETVPMIGRGEKVKVHREHSDSYEGFKIEVLYRDHFGEIHKSVLKGDKDGLRLVEYPLLQAYSQQPQDN